MESKRALIDAPTLLEKPFNRTSMESKPVEDHKLTVYGTWFLSNLLGMCCGSVSVGQFSVNLFEREWHPRHPQSLCIPLTHIALRWRAGTLASGFL